MEYSIMQPRRDATTKQGPAIHLCELGEVVRINAEIRRVMQISREVNLAAINAMLMAKKANGCVAGFGVVSSELRVFSGSLAQDMAELGELNFNLLTLAAAFQRQVRMQRHFQLAAETGKGAAQAIAGLLASQEAALETMRRDIEAGKARLRQRLARALRRCDTGRALSRSARIEAVYGGAMTGALVQVSRQAEATVEQVVAIFKSLEARLAE